MVDHRCQPQDLPGCVTYKRNIFIMVILIAFQDGDQNLHCQLFCNVPMLLKIICFQDLCIIIKHLTVIDIIIDMNLLIRIFSKKFQQIYKMLTFFINHRTYRSIIIVFFCFCFISSAKGKLILRCRNKISADHP